MRENKPLWVMNAVATFVAIWVYFIGLSNLGLGMLVGWWLSWGWLSLAIVKREGSKC